MSLEEPLTVEGASLTINVHVVLDLIKLVRTSSEVSHGLGCVYRHTRLPPEEQRPV